nr:TBC1 domain family member 8B [Ipomoea batatas]
MKAKANSGTAVALLNPPRISADHKRDAYGFAVRPQHVQRYREYANIYKKKRRDLTGGQTFWNGNRILLSCP